MAFTALVSDEHAGGLDVVQFSEDGDGSSVKTVLGSMKLPVPEALDLEVRDLQGRICGFVPRFERGVLDRALKALSL